jgi:enamine deaminase RidA (YjgF/YER057c/UK114 family)
MTTDPVRLVRGPGLGEHAPYADAAVVSGTSQLLFTAGACPLDGSGAIAAVSDVAGQAELVMTNLATALAAAGARLSDVVRTTVYVASQDHDDLVAAWHVVSRAFGDHHAPSTLLGVALLGYPDQLVEVDAIAALPGVPGDGSAPLA